MNTNEICEVVTDRIIAELENGIIPWEKPWVVSTGLRGAFNRVSKKPYSILNQFLLGEPGEYATFKQWVELGGKIRKGERSKMVVFWKPLVKEVEVQDKEDEGEVRKVKRVFYMLKYYNVFHISQVDGVEPLDLDKEEQKFEHEPIKEAELIMKNYCSTESIPLSRGKSDSAYYSPSADKIVLPALKQFKRKEEFYGTAFHEMTHSTGHAKRLNRADGMASYFGSESYSKEELVAEIGSAAIMNYLGLSTEKTERNNVAYIQSWLRALKDDKRMIVSAAGKAEKAMNYILEKSGSLEGAA